MHSFVNRPNSRRRHHRALAAPAAAAVVRISLSLRTLFVVSFVCFVVSCSRSPSAAAATARQALAAAPQGDLFCGHPGVRRPDRCTRDGVDQYAGGHVSASSLVCLCPAPKFRCLIVRCRGPVLTDSMAATLKVMCTKMSGAEDPSRIRASVRESSLRICSLYHSLLVMDVCLFSSMSISRPSACWSSSRTRCLRQSWTRCRENWTKAGLHLLRSNEAKNASARPHRARFPSFAFLNSFHLTTLSFYAFIILLISPCPSFAFLNSILDRRSTLRRKKRRRKKNWRRKKKRRTATACFLQATMTLNGLFAVSTAVF